ncbi:hypothetical protein QYF61_026197 [Mycteria americana]|uniref:Uncharacterized protein n=1 Tax=Mycteria americana TaxID=33587 RepID=A0AAN7MX14_MYCAM|nr:hypothetical protein QYF61_026197 [Mycteria americana]
MILKVFSNLYDSVMSSAPVELSTFRALSHGTRLSRPLKRPKSALLESRVMSSLCILLGALRILNSTLLWALQPRLPLSVTFLASPSLLVRTRSSIVPLLLEKEVIINGFQEPSGLLMTYCVVPPTDIRWIPVKLLLTQMFMSELLERRENEQSKTLTISILEGTGMCTLLTRTASEGITRQRCPSPL